MEARWIGVLILSPFVAAIIYAGVHEFRRYRSEGPAKYGLVYDEETGTTHVTGIAEDDEAYDPEDFDPNDYNRQQAEAEGGDEKRDEEKKDKA